MHVISNQKSHIILATSSIARQNLLATTSISFEVIPSHIDERLVEEKSSPLQCSETAIHLAQAKAIDVSLRYEDRIVVGADQVLELDGALLHKPFDERTARDQIRLMAGRTHMLHSAVAIARSGKVIDSFFRSAFMTVRHLDEAAIRRYVSLAAEKRMLTSVGGYHFEGAGLALFQSVSGNHSTILGLPLQETLKRLASIGF